MTGDARAAAGTAALSDEEILAGIQAVAREHLDWQEPLPLNTHLIEDLELDSVRLLTLAIEVENRFQVCLEDGPMEGAAEGELGIATVADLVAAVRQGLVGRAQEEPAELVEP